jgi:hypothetical protein
MLRRRLNALIVSLLLLPSLATAGQGCLMRATTTSGAAAVVTPASEHDHATHSEHGAPVGLPHAPMQCISAAACAVALIVTPAAQLTASPRGGEQVVGGAMLAPASPARGPEPPPPRA